VIMVNFRIALASLAIAVAGCENNSTDSGTPAGATKLAVAGQPGSGLIGSPLSPAVQIVVQDAQGNTVATSTASITIAIAAGTGTAGAHLGGTVTRAASAGQATFADLTIDLAGTGYRLTATSAGLASVTGSPITVTGGGNLVAYTPQTQTGLTGYGVNIRPAVRLTGQGGVPLASQSVTFAIATGTGSLTGANATTNSNGVAQVAKWVLGAGANSLTATASGTGIAGNPVTFNATGQAGAFNITLQNVGPPFSAAVQEAFDSAVAKWQRVIYQDIADVPNFSSPADQCYPGQPAVGPLTVDDVLILASVDTIDGPGSILGSAGPCLIRNTGFLTVMGAMVFDSADIADLVNDGQLDEVILHEMGHVLGIGTLWDPSTGNCLQLPSSPPGAILDTYFSCARGRAAFDSLGGTSYTGGNKVPVENCGPMSPVGCGAGTVNGHWREPTFGNELMTGYLNGGIPNPLSLLTVASLEDLGYGVNYAGSDPYSHAFTLRAGAAPGRLLALGNDVRRGPIYVLDRNGRVARVIQPH
jgi:hypothetical protein